MADDSFQEKTEQPTEKKQQDARKKGEVLRSKELNTTIVLISGAVLFGCFGHKIAGCLQDIFVHNFSVTRDDIIYENVYIFLHSSFKAVLFALLPFFVSLFILSLMGGNILGGLNFSFNNMKFKLEKLNPISGIKKIFSKKIILETLKSIIKLIIIFGATYSFFLIKIDNIYRLDLQPMLKGINDSLEIIIASSIMLAVVTGLISFIDIPYQIYAYKKKLKMTKQEVKDEMKDTEGKPEIKSKIKEKQQEIKKRRMLSNVAKADVIITNPTHYAVAIKYDEQYDNAPILVAKGIDHVAEVVKKIGKNNGVPLVSLPPLARSIYYNVDIDKEMPKALYLAVAKVLGYVYALRSYKKGEGNKPVALNNIQIPKEYQR